MSPIRAILALTLALALLAGCGKKGPLYRPGDKPAEQPAQQEQPEQSPPPASGY